MRVLAVALLVAGCSFHVDGTAPPRNGVESPGNPGGNDPGNGTGGSGGTAPGNPTNPGSPPSSGTPTPPPAPDMAGAPATSSPDMATHMPPPPPPPAMPRVGQACTADANCMEPDLHCFLALGKGGGAISLPGGYCSKVCDSKTPCPMGSECIATLFGAFCMNVCPTGGCRSGYSCCDSVNACGVDQLCGGGGGGPNGG
jgi:hypothetical protein